MVNHGTSSHPLVPAYVSRDHPVVTRDYSLFTPAIDEMASTIAYWLDEQVDGATIFGPSRFGKSNAVDHWLQQLLSERHGGNVPMVVWSHIDSGSSQSVGRFHAHLLAASKHPLAHAARSPADRFKMLVERWIAMASSSGGKFLVLVIDEAQSMTQREWIWLVQLHSTLEKERIRLCVISIASLQFYDEPIGMALSGGAHVAARFMLESKPFHGIRSAEELAFILRGYDENTEWPPGSGKSYTAGLAPLAWKEGFRMESCAQSLMSAMVESLGENYYGLQSFPMKTVAQCSRRILLKVAGGHNWKQASSSKAWLQTVAQSSHQALMATVSATATKRLKK